jgi:hypothetical protein
MDVGEKFLVKVRRNLSQSSRRPGIRILEGADYFCAAEEPVDGRKPEYGSCVSY